MSRIDNISNIPYLGREYNEEDAQRHVDNYIKDLKETCRPQQSEDLMAFFPLVQQAVATREWFEATEKEKEAFNSGDAKRLMVLEDDPPEAIDTMAITWSLKARVPGRFDQGPAGQGRIKEVVAHSRSVKDHPDHPGEKLISMGKLYGNWINFNIYSRDSKEALRRLLWFEQVMDSFHWYFRTYGFRVIEEGVGDKEKVIIKDLELVKYPLTYFVRSEDTFHVTSQELRSVLVTTNISTS